jgi:hypothetical protein
VLSECSFTTYLQGYRYRNPPDNGEGEAQSTQSTYLSSILKNNIFALTRLLKLPYELQYDSLNLRKHASTSIEWDRYLHPRWPLSYEQYRFLKYHHLYSMEVFAAVMMGITMEFKDYQSLVSTMAHSGLITFAEIVPAPVKKKKPKPAADSRPMSKEAVSRPSSKSSTSRPSSNASVSRPSSRSTAEHVQKQSGKNTPQVHFDGVTNAKVTPPASNIAVAPIVTVHVAIAESTGDLRPIGRIELAHIVHLGVVLQAHRNFMSHQPMVESQFWVNVPSWMLPAYYWGRRARPNFTKRMSSIQDTTNPLLEAFENKVTDCGLSVVSLLARKANRRLEKEKRDIDAKLMAMNTSQMAFEDALSHAVEKADKNRVREAMEAKEWEMQNSAWYKRLYNWTFGKKKISSYPAGFSPEDMKASAQKVVYLRSRLPEPVSYESMEALFWTPIRLNSVELHDEHMTQLSLKDRYAKKKGVVKRPDHIHWLQLNADDGQGGITTRKYVIPKKFTQWLGEMFVGGGVRSVICIARAVMDFENNPQGTSITEPMALFDNFGDDQRIRYVRSCRSAFQDRQLCAARYIFIKFILL